MNNASFDPSRFLDAQETVYANVLAELSAGQKRSHWMWFIFPQLAALGRSATARFYGLAGKTEARAYGEHPVLGRRLRACSELILDIRGRTATQILGSPDDLKLCSCMTLFEAALPEEPVFSAVLGHLYGDARNRLTLEFLQEPS